MIQLGAPAIACTALKRQAWREPIAYAPMPPFESPESTIRLLSTL
jgi:hypothetical protein